MTKIAAIARNPINSPNMTVNDAALLECIIARLSECGADVAVVGEEEELPADTQAVCSMSRTTGTLERLRRAEEQGVVVINPTTAVKNSSRECFMTILHNNGIPQPSFCFVKDAKEIDNELFPCWIKKAQGWSCHKDDVCYAENRQEAIAIIEQHTKRGTTNCIQMQHCPGDIIKFYGVGSKLFYHCYPENTKFGKEKINGAPKHYSFDTAVLREIAQKAAQLIGLDIYGGDAIVTREGDIYIIDINDFPSFTAIREIAAFEIAGLIKEKTTLQK